MTIEKKQDLLLKSLLNFYKKDKHMSKLAECVLKKGDVSLRIIDYLCTNYAKNECVLYYLHPKDKTPFNLYLQYRGQLKAYSKMQFDPFRRHNRVIIPCKFADDNKLETTVAQLNFFKWAIENKVIDYLDNEANRKKVEAHMMKKNEQGKGKVKELSSKTKRHNIQVTVTFK